jgi:hypothetical protein
MDTIVEHHTVRSATPFIIGVTGHRDLHSEDLMQLSGAVTDFVRLIKEQLPDSELEFAIGMADGADLLVAQTVLDLGVRVHAVLPMSLADYAADFDAPSFALLQQVLKHPKVDCDELSLASPLDLGTESRNVMYVNLAQNLLRRTSLMLALWDGRPSQLPGGTADTLLRYLNLRNGPAVGETPLTFIDASEDLESPSSWVYWIPARRRDSAHSLETTTPCFISGLGDSVLQKYPAVPVALHHQLAELDDYNRQLGLLNKRGALARPDSLLDALPRDLPVPDRALMSDIDVEYGKADSLAVYYQRRSDRLFKFFSIATFSMVFAYICYERIVESSVLLYGYLFCMVSGIGVYLALQGQRWFARHLIYRVIAETMRAKFFLRLSGADDLVKEQEVLALSGIDRFHGFELVRCVVKSVEPLVIHPPEPSSPETFAVERIWIQSQERYFISKVERLERKSARIARLKMLLFVVVLAVIVAFIVAGDSLHHIQVGFGIHLKNLLAFFMSLVGVLYAVWELHHNKMATRELLWQYRNQLSHFSRARVQLAHSTTPTRRREILAELGKDSLMESYLWTIHRYHREHEPPASA